MSNAVVNINTATTTHLISAPTSPAFIRVLGYSLLAGGTITATLQDTAAKALSGPLPFAANADLEAWNGDHGVIDLDPGTGLDVVTTGTGQLSGHVKYITLGN